jgi:DNA-binding MarR family transcriptional regulator
MGRGKLQQEIKKKQPFDSLEQEAMLNILRTNDRYGICFTRLFRDHGLTSTQYNILRILRGEGKPLPCLEIAARLLAVVPGITGLLDRLEKDHWVRRERSAADRRVVYVELTDKARQALAELDQPVLDLHQRLIGHLSQDELRELIRLLEKARTSLHEEEC